MAQVTAGPAGAHDAARPGPADFQIVPRAGLVLAAVALAGLVAVIATGTAWGIDFYHVVSGATWTVLDLFLGFVLGPVLARLSIPARTELTVRLMPKMLVLMPTVVVCTLAAGWQLGLQTGDLSAGYSHHGWMVASMIVVAVMAVVALGVLEPANLAVLFELRKPVPDGAVIGRLMRRFIYSAGITGAMQVATLLIMTRLATA